MAILFFSVGQCCLSLSNVFFYYLSLIFFFSFSADSFSLVLIVNLLHCYLSENFCTAIYLEVGLRLASSSFIQNPTTEYNDKVWKRLQQGQCFICKKNTHNVNHPLLSWQLVEIYNSFQSLKTFVRYCTVHIHFKMNKMLMPRGPFGSK